MKASPLKVGLLGLGRMGRNHLRVLSNLKKVSLEFVYDVQAEATKAAAAEFGVRVSKNLDADLASVDAVVIATPTSTHLEYIKMAAGHVRHILAEKPMTGGAAQDAEIMALVQDKNLAIQVGFIERYNPATLELHKLLSASGKVLNLDLTRTDRVSSRITDADVVVDLMIHDIDLALLLNGPVRDLHAAGVLTDGMIDFAQALCVHENGRFSRILASRITEKRERRILATCDDKFVDCNLLDKSVTVNRQSVTQRYSDVKLASVQERIFVSFQEALHSELMAFVNFCQGNAASGAIPTPTAADAQAAMLVGEAIRADILKK